MKRKTALAFLSGMVLWSCSNDDSQGGLNPADQVSHDITVVASTQAAIYQHNILRDSDAATTVDLTASFGLSPTTTLLQTTENLLTFFSAAAESFDVFQKPIDLNQAEVFSDICEEEAGEIHYFPRSSNSKIFIIGEGQSTTGDPGPELFVKFFDRVSRTCTRIPVGHGFLASQRGALVVGENLYLAYQDFTSSQYVLAQIDLITEQRVDDLRFDQPWTIAIDGGMEIHVFFDNDSYLVYDAATYDLLTSSTLDDKTVLGPEGILDTNFWDNGLVVLISYPQPSAISTGPAVMDLSTGDLVLGNDSFLFNVRDQLFNILEYDSFFVSYAVNLRTGAVVAGFARAGQPEGGIVYTNFDGTILKVVQFEGIPQQIVLR